MANILFIHPNYPGQFKQLIPSLLENTEHKLAYITRKKNVETEGVLIERYDHDKVHRRIIPPLLRGFDNTLQESEQTLAAATRLRDKGFVPDLVIGHTSWGGMLFIGDLFPKARTIAYCEFYRAIHPVEGLDNASMSFANRKRARCENINSLLSMEAMDVGITPTQWQLDQHTPLLQQKLKLLHEGIDTSLCAPDDQASYRMGKYTFTKADRVVTYVSRSFEPARGFLQYMKALEILCHELPDTHFLMVGNPKDRVYYSTPLPDGKTYLDHARETFDLDWDRVHFTGKLLHIGFRKVLQISAAHVYLTIPLFVSWSMLEAMSMATPLVASDTPPVSEFVKHNHNGLLVDYNNPQDIADSVLKLMGDQTLSNKLGENARQTIVERIDIAKSLRVWHELIEENLALAKA